MVATRKNKKTSKQSNNPMTIPQLRKAFDHIEGFTQNLVKQTKNPKERRVAFQKKWRSVFYRPVDDKTADVYLNFEAKKHCQKTKKTKKSQKGGSALAGAPLDYSTRPGDYGVHGVFPAYVESGFDIYDKINQDSVSQQCGKEFDKFPLPPSNMGSNLVSQEGGKRRKSKKTRRNNRKNQMGGFPTIAEFAQSLSYRPILATTPTMPIYDGQMAWKGQPLPLSSSPASDNPGYQSIKPTILNATATSIQRDLSQEIRS